MKPIILYGPNTTNFNNNGLGVLDEAISAKVVEERNGTYELEITYPITGKRFSDITYSCIIRCLTIPNGDYQTFRIYAISKPINGIITINAEHISYQLAYIVADAFTATSAAEAMVKIKQKAMTDCPFTFWTDKQTVANYNQEVPENIKARLGGVSGSILDVYGGEYEFDNYTVKLHGQRGADRGVTLSYGKNITDIEQDENISNVYTSIVAYWKNEDEVVKTGVIDCQYASHYPFKRTQAVDFSSDFQEKPTVQQLTARANSYMTANDFGIPKVSIKVSFAALWQSEEYKNLAVFERVYLCDTVTIHFEKLGINAQAKVVKTTYNVMLDRYDSIELGEARTNLAGRLASDIGNVDRKLDETKSDLQKAMERAAELITGNKGGHVIFVRDANGKPQEICVMDTEDITTAQKVWRWNLSGLGYSKTGYTPQAMPLALTMDGAIVANFITVGELNAQVIKAGILADKKGYNSWNMATGEFKLSYNTKVKTSGGTEYEVANANDVATAKSEAIDGAATATARAIQDYDGALNQLKVFNKLTNNGQAQGIVLTDGKLYVNATWINTGMLSGGGDGQGNYKFALNMATGHVSMKDGEFIGSISASNITGSTISGTDIIGNAIKTANSGERIEMNTTSSIMGYNASGMHNLLNMMQSGTTQMTLDSDTQINIRTPNLYVTDQSAGTESATVYQTKTDTDKEYTEEPDTAHNYDNGRECYRLIDVRKLMPSDDPNIKEIDLLDVGRDQGNIHVTLPVILKIRFKKERRRLGMVLSGATADSFVV